jgi:hypothetical protein
MVNRLSSSHGGSPRSPSTPFGGNNTINVESLPQSVTLTLNLSNRNAVNFSPNANYSRFAGRDLGLIQGPVSLSGKPASLDVSLYDQEGSGKRTLDLDFPDFSLPGDKVSITAPVSSITVWASGAANATSQVNVSPTSHDLTKIGATIKVNGNAATSITVDDQADQGLPLKYIISSGELKSEYFAGNIEGFGWYPLATIDYNGRPSLNLHMSTGTNGNDNDNEADVLSSPGNLNLWGGSNTTVNVCKISENLDGLGFLGVHSDDNAQTVDWSDPQGSLAKLMAPTVNIYDQASADANESYSLAGHQLFRSAASQPTVEIEYDLGTHLSLYTGQVAGTVDVEGTPNATNIICGAADSISVTDSENILGLLSLNGDGGSLTVTSLVQYYTPDNGENSTQTANVFYDISNQQVNWNEKWHVKGENDPEQLNSPHKPVHYDYRGTYTAGLAYTNLANITLNSSPGDTTSFTVESTAPGTPVTINASSDGTQANQFTIGHDGTVKDIQSQVNVNAAGAGDAMTLDDSKAATTDALTIANGQSGDVQVGMGLKDTFFGTGGSLDLNNLGSLTVSLSKAPSDVVHLSASKVTAFTINGDPSEFNAPPPGPASLYVDVGAASDAKPGPPGTGQLTFTNGSHKTISYSTLTVNPVSLPSPPWTDTGGHLVSVVAGHGEVFGLDGNNSVWVYRDNGGWAHLGGDALSISVGSDAVGQDELWVVGANYSIYRYDQGSWAFIGGQLASIAAGRGEVFGLGGGNAVWVYRDKGGWANTGASGMSMSVGTDASGTNDELWLVGGNYELYRYTQGSWLDTQGQLASIAAGHGEVFGRDGKNSVWIYRDNGGWDHTVAFASSLAVGTDASGKNDELWVSGGSNSIWLYNGGAWTPTGGNLVSMVAGRGEVFGFAADQSL